MRASLTLGFVAMSLVGAACSDSAATRTTAVPVAGSTTVLTTELGPTSTSPDEPSVTVASRPITTPAPSSTAVHAPSTPPQGGDPGSAYIAGFGLGSGRIDVLDGSGVLVRSIETTSASAFRTPIQTVVPGRVVADRLTSDGELLVLDAVDGEIRSLALEVPKDAIVTPVEAPLARHVLVISSAYPPELFPGGGFKTLSIDVDSLEVTDLRTVLPVTADEELSEVPRFVSTDGIVALYGFNYESEPGPQYTSYSVLFDIRSPEKAVRVDGVLADLTDDRLLTVSSFAPTGPLGSTFRLLDRLGVELWSLDVPGASGAILLDDARLLVSGETEVGVLDAVTGDVESVLSGRGMMGAGWLAGRSVIGVQTAEGLVLLDPDAHEVASLDGSLSPLVSRLTLRDVHCLTLVSNGQDRSDPPAVLIELSSGRVLHEYGSLPTRFSADGCTTLSGDARTTGELVVHGAVIPLGDGEIPLAVSSDASTAVIADGVGGTTRIRRLDADAADVVLPDRFSIAFFIES